MDFLRNGLHSAFASALLVLPLVGVASGRALGSTTPISEMASSNATQEDLDAKVAPPGFDRDVDFASRLANRNMRDEARWVVADLKGGKNLSELQKASIAFLEARISVSAFDVERDFDKAMIAYESARSAVDSYLKLAPDGAFAGQARYMGGDLDRKLGKKIAEQIRREPSIEKIGEMRKLGEEAFGRAISYFSAQASTLQGPAQTAGPATAAEADFLAALYAVPNAYFDYADLYGKDDPIRAEKLRRAGDLFEEFLLECPSDYTIAFEASVKAGNVWRELGQGSRARDYYFVCFELLYWYDQDGNRHVRPPEDFNDALRLLILEAATEYSKLLNREQQYDAVLERVEDVRKGIPNAEEYDLDFLVEVARAYAGKNQDQKAIEVAQRVRTRAVFGSETFASARDLLESLGVDFEGAGPIPAQEIISPVYAAYQEGRFTDAMRAFERSLSRLRGRPEEAKYGGDLFTLAGQVYQKAGRPIEAILLFETAGTRFPQSRLAATALLLGVDEACNLWVKTQSKDPWIDEWIQTLLDHLSNGWPDSDPSNQAQSRYISALQKMGLKDAFEVAKLKEDQLRSLSKTDPNLGKRSFDAGLMFFRAGGLIANVRDKAQLKRMRDDARAGMERTFAQLFDWTAAQTTLDPTERSRNEQKEIEARLCLARAYLWEPGSQPERTQQICREIDDRASRSTIARAKSLDTAELFMTVALKLGKLDDAVRIVEGMSTKAPESSKTVKGLRRVGDAILEEIPKKKDLPPADRIAMIDTATRLYRSWIASGEKQEGQVDSLDYAVAGARLFQLGLWKNDQDLRESFYFDIDPKKLAFRDQLESAVELIKKSLVVNETAPQSDYNAPVNRFRLGQALGALDRWSELAEHYGSLITDLELVVQQPQTSILEINAVAMRSVRLPVIQIVNERAYALARLSEKGDKKAGEEAQLLAAAVVRATDPGTREPTKEWWMARYVYALACVNNGERVVARNVIESYLVSDRELDRGKWGFAKLIQDLHARVK